MLNQTNSMDNILEIRNIVAGYGKSTVLKDISIRICRQEIVALVGANGAGKTTTLRTVFGLTACSSGSITFNGKDITKLKAHNIVSLGLGFVPQEKNVFPSLTVLENLHMGGYSISRKDTSENLENVFRIFPLLKQRMTQRAGTLSGGERQMLAIGRSLMISPKLLLLDEPSLGLAPLMVDAVFEQIKIIRQAGVTILVTEQNARKALEVADRGYIMGFGTISHENSAEHLLNDGEVRRVYLGEG